MLDKLKHLRKVNFYQGTAMQEMCNREEWENAEAQIRSRYSPNEFKSLGSHGYSGLSVEERAKAIGLGEKYQYLYRMASRSVHKFDPAETGLMDYLEDPTAVKELLKSRRDSLESSRNMLLGRLSMIFSELIGDPLIQAELWSLGLGYEKNRGICLPGDSARMRAENGSEPGMPGLAPR